MRQTYLDQDQLPFLFCPGCGHGTILNALDQALVRLDLDPSRIVIVTDIGCAGLSDRYFSTHAFHGLHGRSITYATGIKLADPDLKVIVLIGDGGCGIGGHHLLNAARRNIGVTTLVFNNLNYGMTGGEHSVTTPYGAHTATTRYGQVEQPFDIAGTVAINGASFAARTTTFDAGLPDLIVQALGKDGFSLLDIWELCTAHFVPNNRFNKAALLETIQHLGFQTGILPVRPRPPLQQAYIDSHRDVRGQPPFTPHPIPTQVTHNLDAEVSLVLAGAAGTKIGSAATIFCEGAMASGLWVSQRDDYPVTVKSGHSISELILSPEPVLSSGIRTPDYMVVLFPEGLAKTRQRINNLSPQATLVLNAELPPIDSPAHQVRLDFKSALPWGRKKEYRAIMALAYLLEHCEIYPLEAFQAAIHAHTKFAQDNLAALNAASLLQVQ